MNISPDGLVFIQIGHEEPWYINVASIVRIIHLSRESCEAAEVAYPATGLDIMGREGLLRIGGIKAQDFKKKVDKAIKDHYIKIMENELLGE